MSERRICWLPNQLPIPWGEPGGKILYSSKFEGALCNFRFVDAKILALIVQIILEKNDKPKLEVIESIFCGQKQRQNYSLVLTTKVFSPLFEWTTV